MDLTPYRIPGHDSIFYVPDFITKEEEDYLVRKIMESPQQKWKVLSNRSYGVSPKLRVPSLVLSVKLAPLAEGGDLTSRGILFSQPMPPFVDKYPDIITRLRATGAFDSSPHGAPNHVILNEYLPGQGIMPHEDGPRYHPVVATVSLGTHCVFNYYQYKEQNSSEGDGKVIDSTPVASMILERRSLVISTGCMYTSHLHGIQEIEEDRVHIDHQTNESDGLQTKIDNLDLLRDEHIKNAICKGQSLKRGVRYSLTCRDVGRVSNAGSAVRLK